MASYTDLKQYMNTIDSGIMEVIGNYHLIGDLVEGKQTTFVPNMMALAKREWSWAIHNPELIMEMISEVYIKVFVRRSDSVFKSYIPKGKEGHEAPLENFLHFIMRRAYQEVSKVKYGEMKKYKEINPMDGQSMDDAVDHLIHDTSKVKTTQEYAHRIEDITSYIGFYEERLQHLIQNDPKNTVRLNSLKNKIEALEEELNLLEKESMFNKDKSYSKDEIEHPMTHDEKMFFDRMITDLQDVIRDTSVKNPDSQIKVFKLLIDEYSPSEIAKILGVSSAMISGRISGLKESIKELANKYKENGDSDLYNSLQRLMSSGSGKRVANRLQMGQ